MPALPNLHRAGNAEQNRECGYCLAANPPDRSDQQPHYPLPPGTPAALIAVAQLHRAIQQSLSAAGEPRYRCSTCRAEWPCPTVAILTGYAHELANSTAPGGNTSLHP